MTFHLSVALPVIGNVFLIHAMNANQSARSDFYQQSTPLVVRGMVGVRAIWSYEKYLSNIFHDLKGRTIYRNSVEKTEGGVTRPPPPPKKKKSFKGNLAKQNTQTTQYHFPP